MVIRCTGGEWVGLVVLLRVVGFLANGILMDCLDVAGWFRVIRFEDDGILMGCSDVTGWLWVVWFEVNGILMDCVDEAGREPRRCFQEDGSLLASSLVLREFGRFSISMASL